VGAVVHGLYVVHRRITHSDVGEVDLWRGRSLSLLLSRALLPRLLFGLSFLPFPFAEISPNSIIKRNV